MVSVKPYILYRSKSIEDAVRVIESVWQKIVVVVAENGLVQGTVTDGDIRRHFLRERSLEGTVAQVMNPNPLTIPFGTAFGDARNMLVSANLECAPLVDSEGKCKDLFHILDIAEEFPRNAQVEKTEIVKDAVIMAGGEGRRLRPLTENIPKPLIEVSGKAILEHQVTRLAEAGIERVFISVNYLAHKIEERLGHGEKYGIKIHYLRESKKLGTGGALSLARDFLLGPTIVQNGDVLTSLQYKNFEKFHIEQSSDLTVAVSNYAVQVPFGVMKIEDEHVVGMDEKPVVKFFCNAGIYLVSNELLTLVPDNSFFDMPQLFEKASIDKRNVVAFPIHEYWSDVGTLKDLEMARTNFS
jgi:dTDP-glucose pyrophosphorylase